MVIKLTCLTIACNLTKALNLFIRVTLVTPTIIVALCKSSFKEDSDKCNWQWCLSLEILKHIMMAALSLNNTAWQCLLYSCIMVYFLNQGLISWCIKYNNLTVRLSLGCWTLNNISGMLMVIIMTVPLVLCCLCKFSATFCLDHVLGDLNGIHRHKTPAFYALTKLGCCIINSYMSLKKN